VYLKSLSVKNFRKFKDFSVAFPSDITIVKGPNEQGKSTILLAILAGLFYDPKKSNKDIEALRSWNSKKLYKIIMEFESNGSNIILEKNFDSKDIILENKTTSEKLQTYKEVADYFYEIGSIRSLSLFESTSCVKHDALSLITEGKREISQALQSLLTSSSESVSPDRVIKKMNEMISNIKKGLKQASKTPGALKEVGENIKDLEEKRDRLKTDLDELSAKVDYLGTIGFEYDELKKNFDSKDVQYKMNQKYFQTMNDLENLNAQFEKLNTDLEMIEELERGREYILFQLEKMKALKDFDPQLLIKQKSDLREKEAKLGYLEKYFKSIEDEKDGAQNHKILKYFAAAFFAVGFLGFYQYWFFSLFVISLVFFISSLFFKKRKITKERSKTMKEGEALEKELTQLKKKINTIFSKNKVKNEIELNEKIKKYDEFISELGKIESKEEGILRGNSFSDLKKERSDLAGRIAIEEEKISKEQKINIPIPQEQRLLELDIKKISKSMENLKREILQVSAVSLQYNIDKEDLVEIEEEIEFLKEKKYNIERKLKVLECASGTIAEAQEKIISKSKNHIEDYMKKYLAIITDGRYDNIEVNNDLSFNVWSEEKKDMIVPEKHLSQGTIDQFYLIARFAILDALNKGKKSLVLLDDPFHSFDDKRREKTKQVLNDLTSKFQVVLFTHSSDYDDWGEVIEI
jgi:uncharacterized protein YhaN